MQVGITGGSGFIGTRLASALLAAGHAVRIYDLAPSALHGDLLTCGDVRDQPRLQRFLHGCTCVIDLAAEHRDDVRPLARYREVNVGGATSVVQAAATLGIARLVFVSSAAVYGPAPQPPDEHAPLRPDHPYGRSKAEAETVYRDWAAAQPERRSLLLLRPSVVFGPGNRGNVRVLVEQLHRRRFLMVGSGTQRKSMAYVDNLVDYLCQQLECRPGTWIRNYADPPDLSMRELVGLLRLLLADPRRTDLAARLAGQLPVGRGLPYPLALAAGHCCDLFAALRGRPLAIGSARIRKFCSDSRIDCSALRQDGHQPRTPLLEGLALTVASVLAAPG